MAKKQKVRSTRSLHSRRGRRAKEQEWLMALAAEPVPVGSGVCEFGRGQYAYVKTNHIDGSTRIFWFRSAAVATRATQVGVQAEEPMAWDLDWLEAG